MANRHRPGRNLAAAAGGWSTRHRRKAILGWLAFVTVAFAIGTTIGQRYLTDVQQSNGQAKRALAVYEKAFPYHSGEQVLIQGRGATHIGDPVFAAAIGQLITR